MHTRIQTLLLLSFSIVCYPVSANNFSISAQMVSATLMAPVSWAADYANTHTSNPRLYNSLHIAEALNRLLYNFLLYYNEQAAVPNAIHTSTSWLISTSTTTLLDLIDQICSFGSHKEPSALITHPTLQKIILSGKISLPLIECINAFLLTQENNADMRIIEKFGKSIAQHGSQLLHCDNNDTLKILANIIALAAEYTDYISSSTIDATTTSDSETLPRIHCPLPLDQLNKEQYAAEYPVFSFFKSLSSTQEAPGTNNLYNATLMQILVSKLNTQEIRNILPKLPADMVGGMIYTYPLLEESQQALTFFHTKYQKIKADFSCLGSHYQSFNLFWENISIQYPYMQNLMDSLLITAARIEDLRSLQFLLDIGANKNAQNSDGQTAMLFAVKNNNTEILSLLLRNGAAILANNFKQTAFHLAVENKSVESLLLLLNHDPSLADQENEQGLTPLMLAAKQAHGQLCQEDKKYFLQIFQLLLQNKLVDINKPCKKAGNNNGYTALLFAANHSTPNIEIIKFLLAHNADKTVKISQPTIFGGTRKSTAYEIYCQKTQKPKQEIIGLLRVE